MARNNIHICDPERRSRAATKRLPAGWIAEALPSFIALVLGISIAPEP
jgi:hypothetical protein